MEPVRVLEEKRVHLLDYWRTIRRRRWIILSAFSLTLASGIIYSFMSKPIYLATSQIEIGSQSLKLFSLGEGVQWEPYDPEFQTGANDAGVIIEKGAALVGVQFGRKPPAADGFFERLVKGLSVGLQKIAGVRNQAR